MSKKSKSKRIIQQGKDFVQPNYERYNKEIVTMAEATNNKQKGDG